MIYIRLRYMFAAVSILILFALALSGGCSSDVSKTDTKQENDTMKSESISGQVQTIQAGKDGYTAKIVDSDNQIYFATVSHANLKENAHQYRTLKVGEIVTVTGDIWKMGDKTQITVRELK